MPNIVWVSHIVVLCSFSKDMLFLRLLLCSPLRETQEETFFVALFRHLRDFFVRVQ